jgi:cell division protein FtsI (penicillin-binding protein 3)
MKTKARINGGVVEVRDTVRRIRTYPGRRSLAMGIFAILATLLAARAFDLQMTSREFLQDRGDERSIRRIPIPASRGIITDRNGEPLAISTPVWSVWTTPKQIFDCGKLKICPCPQSNCVGQLAQILGEPEEGLRGLLRQRIQRDFLYLRRHIAQDLATALEEAHIPGLNLVKEPRRYYPDAEVSAHLVGFTNVDDHGQEGMELAFEGSLRAVPGEKKVLKDLLGRVVKDIDILRPPHPGQDLTLSIDKRIQYIAYRELTRAVAANHASAGSMVVLDAWTGEVLAAVNQPSYNPNNRAGLRGQTARNRVVTDVFEPGSTMKPFTIAAALETGRYRPTTPIDARPGHLTIGRHTIKDLHNYGLTDVTGVIVKSSNVGAARIALSIPAQALWRVLAGVGFGQPTRVGFPAEQPGFLPNYRKWHEIEWATISFGYGLSSSAMQLAHAYGVFATGGVVRPMSLLRRDVVPVGERVISEETANAVLAMMEKVVQSGTGQKAAIPGFRVAGKTGTVHKNIAGARGYAEKNYLSLFAGIVPVARPRIVGVVVIDDPKGTDHYGGLVAAPVFAAVLGESLRILNIPADGQHEEEAAAPIMAHSAHAAPGVAPADED